MEIDLLWPEHQRIAYEADTLEKSIIKDIGNSLGFTWCHIHGKHAYMTYSCWASDKLLKSWYWKVSMQDGSITIGLVMKRGTRAVRPFSLADPDLISNIAQWQKRVIGALTDYTQDLEKAMAENER